MSQLRTVEQDPFLPWQWLLARPCWGVAAGAGTGGQVSLHFGRKLRRVRELSNPMLKPDLRVYQGEVILFIECKWSLHSNGKVLFDTDRDENAEQMVKALQTLVGETVSEIRGMLPPEEVSILLNDRVRLSVTADARGRAARDNYTLIVPDKSYVIGPDLRLRIEQRKGVLETIPSKRKRRERTGRDTGPSPLPPAKPPRHDKTGT